MEGLTVSRPAALVLVVDDHDDGRDLVRVLLEESGFAVAEAANGKAALDRMVSAPEPALVILDLEMPVMSGAEVIEVMRADDRLSGVPVLIHSGSVRSKIPLRYPVAGFIAKPCESNELVATVKACIARSMLSVG